MEGVGLATVESVGLATVEGLGLVTVEGFSLDGSLMEGFSFEGSVVSADSNVTRCSSLVYLKQDILQFIHYLINIAGFKLIDEYGFVDF